MQDVESLEKLRKAIRRALLAQLTGKEKYYVDLVDDYMSMWDTKNKLMEDIETRGVTVPYITQSGENLKKNESVDQLIKLNAQMLKLLDSLGIKPPEKGNTLNEEM